MANSPEALAALERLHRLDRGLAAFRALLHDWMRASGWTYAGIAQLAELAVTETEAAGIPPFTGAEAKGDLFVVNGHVWRAQRALRSRYLAPVYSNSIQSTPQWDKDVFEHVAATRRLFNSQINNLLLGQTNRVYAQVFDALGTLNEWLDQVRSGNRPWPVDLKLAAMVEQSVVLRDDFGALNAEQFLAVYLGLGKAPKIPARVDKGQQPL
jgi:hypothetical protein